MTEYDYSPEAFDAFIQKQEKISRWVNKTLDHRGELRNPFTPATPAVHALGLRPTDESDDDSDYPRRHTKRRERNRDRDREQARVEREREKVKDRHFSSRRHRSASVDASTARPTYKPPPPPLPIPPYPTTYPQQYYPPPKLTSPRDSQHSSRTSTTAFHSSPTSYYPPQHVPYYNPVPQPYRSQSYSYSPDSKYPYTAPPYYQSGTYPQQTNAPQLPYSAYETKQPPLLKRIFLSFKGNKQQQQLQQPVPQPPHQRRLTRRKRSTSF